MAKRKKLHWTQTPEGRERMSQLAKAMHRAGGSPKRKEKKGGKGSGSEEGQDHTIAYAFGHVEAWLEVYARSHGLSPSTVTYRVAELLRRSARR